MDPAVLMALQRALILLQAQAEGTVLPGMEEPMTAPVPHPANVPGVEVQEQAPELPFGSGGSVAPQPSGARPGPDTRLAPATSDPLSQFLLGRRAPLQFPDKEAQEEYPFIGRE
jgi:hypothetical protein